MSNPELADQIQAILLEKKTFLRLSTASKLLEADAETIGETIRDMKQIRPDLFDVIMSNELIITMNDSYAYEAHVWKRNGGFMEHSNKLHVAKIQKEYPGEMAPVFVMNKHKSVLLDHEWVNNLAILSLKICAVAVTATLLFWYFDKY